MFTFFIVLNNLFNSIIVSVTIFNTNSSYNYYCIFIYLLHFVKFSVFIYVFSNKSIILDNCIVCLTNSVLYWSTCIISDY